MLKDGSAAAARDQNSRNFLHYVPDNDVLATQLIAAGCDVNLEDNEGYTPLIFAVGWGFSKLTQILLEAGASCDTDIYFCSSTRPLHLAVKNKHTNIVALLVEAGADLNALDDNHSTPLHLIARETDHRKLEKNYIYKFQVLFYNYSYWDRFLCFQLKQ